MQPSENAKPHVHILILKEIAIYGNFFQYRLPNGDIQSAYSIPTSEKAEQEKASLLNIGDNFKKVIVVHDVTKPVRDEDGILTLSIYDFLMNPDSLLL